MKHLDRYRGTSWYNVLGLGQRYVYEKQGNDIR